MAKTTRHTSQKPIPISTTGLAEEPSSNNSIPNSSPLPANGAKTSAPNIPTFFQKMAAVAKPDWGPRATVYLYRVEPYIDRLRAGDSKYIMKYDEPIDEQRVLADHGSGRYKAVLNFRKAGAEMGDIIDSHYFDLLNMKYPPKVPIGEWTDDPRNKRWAWAKEANTPAPVSSTSATDVTQAFHTFMDIQDRVAERMQTANAPAAPVQDPFDVASQIMKMHSDNPMLAILQEQLRQQNAAMEAAREREFRAQEAAREREFKLQEQLRQAMTQAPTSKGLLEQLTELAAATEKLEPVKKLFGGLLGGITDSAPVRSKMSGTMEFISEVIQSEPVRQLATGVATALSQPRSPANNAADRPLVPVQLQSPQHAQQNPATTPDQEMERFIQRDIVPRMMEVFDSGRDGEEFAYWVYMGWPYRLEQLQRFSHPRLPGVGVPAMIAALKYSPWWGAIPQEKWEGLAHREAELTQFLTEFCAWQAPADEEEQETPVARPVTDDDGIIEYDGQEGEERES